MIIDTSSHPTDPDYSSSVASASGLEMAVQPRRNSQRQVADLGTHSNLLEGDRTNQVIDANPTTLKLPSRHPITKRGLQARTTEQPLQEKIKTMRIKTKWAIDWSNGDLRIGKTWKDVPTDKALAYAKKNTRWHLRTKTRDDWKKHTAKRERAKPLEKMPAVAESPWEDQTLSRTLSRASTQYYTPKGSFSNLDRQSSTGSEKSKPPKHAPRPPRAPGKSKEFLPWDLKALTKKGEKPTSKSQGEAIWENKIPTPESDQGKSISHGLSDKASLSRHKNFA